MSSSRVIVRPSLGLRIDRHIRWWGLQIPDGGPHQPLPKLRAAAGRLACPMRRSAGRSKTQEEADTQVTTHAALRIAIGHSDCSVDRGMLRINSMMTNFSWSVNPRE